MSSPEIKCDLLVIGSGLAGMAASLFAAGRDIDVLQVGHTSELVFSTGMLDLLGVHPVEEGHVWDDPWAGIEQLIRDIPLHPYGRLGIQTVRDALEEFVAFMAETGHSYVMHPDRNAKVITPVGIVKTTYAVPETMIKGVEALEKRIPALMVDFHGLKGYSARQIIETLGDQWPSLRAVRIPFPGLSRELFIEHMARSLDCGNTSEKLAESIKRHLGDEQAVGFPAILGINRTREVMENIESYLGVPLFEVPTMVPGVTGLRMHEVFEQELPRKGVRTHYFNRVTGFEKNGDGAFRVFMGSDIQPCEVLSRAVVLASGRFLGKGLRADRKGVRETIFDLPVYQPPLREQWHHKDFLHPGGHLINRAGVMIDDYFRPVDENGEVIHSNLYVAGSILANQDWMRQKCGSGLAISTAYGAIKAYQKFSAKK